MTLDWRPEDIALLSSFDPTTRAQIEALIESRVEQGTREVVSRALRNVNLAQDGARIGVFDIDMTTGDSNGSAMWAELLGLPRDRSSITRREWIKLLHPDDRDRVLDKVAAAIKSGADTIFEYRIVLPDGDVRWLSSRNLIVGDENGQATAYGMLQDITERTALEEKVRRAAYHDDLTGLPNRRFFMERLNAACQDASQESRVGLAIYDLDFLKRANDCHGHDAGDTLLKTVADRLQDVSGDQDIVARLGGDEFALLMRTDDPLKLRSIAEKSLDALRQPVLFRGSEICSATSVGGAISTSSTTPATTVFRHADQALLRAKRSARGSYVEHQAHPAATYASPFTV